jgi:hypothetical protein
MRFMDFGSLSEYSLSIYHALFFVHSNISPFGPDERNWNI